MIKRYILDTSVLLHDPGALYNFQEHDVYILREVTEELDRFKRGTEEKNVHARQVARTLEDLTAERITQEGIALGEEKGKLYFLSDDSVLNRKEGKIGVQQQIVQGLDQLLQIAHNNFGYNDDVILRRAKKLQEEDKEKPVVIVSKDITLRIRARTLGLHAEDYRYDKAAIDLNAFFRKGNDVVEVPNELVDQLHSKNRAEVPDYFQEIMPQGMTENQYFTLKSGSQSIFVKYRKGELQKLRENKKVEGISPRNNGQRFLLDACLDSEIEIVSALGKAGTGKTIIALAAGIYQATQGTEKRYEKVVVFRPMMQAGKELGFLPGDLDDKIGPYFKPIDTALKIILGDAAADYAKYSDFIECMPINFARGDTIHNSYIIIDEAQNFTAKELKLIGSRAGIKSKLVIVGDPFQSDNPYLDEKSNGLTVLTDRFRGKVPEFAYVVLDKGERSRVAGIFADYL